VRNHEIADREEKINENERKSEHTLVEKLEGTIMGEKEKEKEEVEERLYILADSSYGTYCVDEVAAEHVDADVVHYGRSCQSPPSRLPVV
jgi:diphthamide biosynthesis protein 2